MACLLTSLFFITTLLILQAFTSAQRNPPLDELLLRPRQTSLPSGIPTACQSECDAVTSSIKACPDPSCVCTVQHDNDLTTCAACVIGDDPGTSVVNAVEAMVSQFHSTCATGGYSVNSATVTAPTGTTTPIKGAGSIAAVSLSLAGCLMGMVLGAALVLV